MEVSLLDEKGEALGGCSPEGLEGAGMPVGSCPFVKRLSAQAI